MENTLNQSKLKTTKKKDIFSIFKQKNLCLIGEC